MSQIPPTTSVGTTRSNRHVRGIRASWLLLLVALVPLAGLVGATAVSIDAAATLRSDIAETERAAELAGDLTRLDGALFDEMIWRAVVGMGDTLGAPTDLMANVFGTDPDADLAEAVATTDGIVADLGDTAMAARLEVIRATEFDLAGLLDTFSNVRADIRAELQTALDQVSDAATAGDASRELRDSVALLENGIVLRGAVADAYYQYFAIVFDIRDSPHVEVARLVETRAEYRDALQGLSDATAADSAISDALGEVLDEPSLAAFAVAIDETIEESLTDGLPDQAAELTLGNVLRDLDGLNAAYKAGGVSNKTTLRLLDSATEQVLDATGQRAVDADRRVLTWYAIAAALIAATVAAVLLSARFIVRPLNRLRLAVDGLHETDEADISMTGPVEVKAAAHALRQSKEHFSLVTSQARALAAGDLQADVLDERVEGGLGDALQSAVDRLRDALTQQEEFRRRLSHEASHDGLTQIPNRNASMAQLARSLARTRRSDTQLAVLFIDLDNFKDVNDEFGHHAGDSVLMATAQRLVGQVREGDFVGRLGGDEFIVIAEPVAGIDDAVDLSQRILTALAAPVSFDRRSATVHASVGVALADSTHLTADELLRDADLAVYRAKEAGRGGVAICDEDLRREVADDLDLKHAIEQALEQDELVVHYQPIVSTTDQSVQGFEALVRWQRSSTGELVPPGVFIGFAERSPLIIDIDRWVIESVVEQLAAWQDDPRYAGVPVAVNISGRHIAHDDVVTHVLAPLERHGVDPSLLVIELTESALFDELDTVAVKLGELRAAGVRVAIDDFGTGYTSLAHLRSLPVDILKIDRTFTANAAADEGEASIVKLIVDAGHLLGATITAEGIETSDEAERLAGLGSDNLQGFFFARPQPVELLDGIAVPRLTA